MPAQQERCEVSFDFERGISNRMISVPTARLYLLRIPSDSGFIWMYDILLFPSNQAPREYRGEGGEQARIHGEATLGEPDRLRFGRNCCLPPYLVFPNGHPPLESRPF